MDHNSRERNAAANVGHLRGERYACEPDTRITPPKTAID
jgi:hypothetical protein